MIDSQVNSWNVAANNAFDTFNLIVECQNLIKVCKFGTMNFGEHYDTSTISLNKKEALERIILNLQLIIIKSNQLVDKNCKKIQVEVDGRLTKLEDVLTFKNGVSSIIQESSDERTKQRVIYLIQPHYNNCLTEAIDLFRKTVASIKGILGRISDEVDLETLKQQIIDGG